jgi:hypothetical protein
VSGADDSDGRHGIDSCRLVCGVVRWRWVTQEQRHSTPDDTSPGGEARDQHGRAGRTLGEAEGISVGRSSSAVGVVIRMNLPHGQS